MKQGESARALKCTLRKHSKEAEIYEFLHPMTGQHQMTMANKGSGGQLKEF